jgi:hypothetical protein
LADPEYLARHNRKAMSPTLYRRLAECNGLILEWIGYIGGMDPSIIRLARGPNIISPRRAIPSVVTLVERRFRETALGERLQHPWLSSYMLATFRRSG